MLSGATGFFFKQQVAALNESWNPRVKNGISKMNFRKIEARFSKKITKRQTLKQEHPRIPSKL